ncbi:hypothetical protein [Actomonas aquatica]|uniref:DUF3160 domain-containing protein n=1 Tax=Actomonas aquatica TaxID=2866162 RepID=A0ABZ1C7H1_9BACT|nr:hypothetical protein [Opitutus sp. WL0086]WRQ87203.1 hypothetical protein K1X11_020515 [Opitutus sp. WL0086]
MTPLRLLPATVAVVLLAATFTAPGLRAQTPDRPAEVDESILLPPFLVEPPSRPDRWMLATTPGFELLTTHDADFARTYTKHYFRQLALVRELVPDRYLWEPALPVRHIVVASESRRQETDTAMQQAMAALRDDRRDGQEAPDSRFLPNMRLAGHDSSVVFAFHDDPEEPNSRGIRSAWELMQGEHLRRRDNAGFYLSVARLEEKLSRRTPALPAWLIAGLTGVYRNGVFGSKTFEAATYVWYSPAQSDLFRRDPDQPRELLVLPTLFSNPPPSDPATRARWEQQAALFVRWALFADDAAHRDALWDFVDQLELSRPTDDTFRASFGFGLAEARDRLSEYLNSAVSETFALTLPRDFYPPSVATRRTRPADVGLIMGEWERLETGYVRQHAPALTELYLNRARATVQRAREAGNSPALAALSGLIEYEAGAADAARAELEYAVVSGERRPRVLQALADLRFDELRARHADTEFIPGEEVGAVRVMLNGALEQSPALPEVYVQLAELWRQIDAPLTRTDLAPLARGVRLFPHEPNVIATMVALQAERGQLAFARQILNYARARTRDARTAHFYDDLRARLDAATTQP